MDPARPAVERQRSTLMVRMFGRVLARHMRSSFDAVRVLRPGVPNLATDRPVVLYCNHPSWWDAAFLAVLATTLFPSRRAYGPIDQGALARYRFMARIGFFGLQANAAGARDWLRIGGALLQRPDTLLLITPEGSFTDPRTRPLTLRSGLAALLWRHPQVQVVPLALDYPFWTERTPEALAAFGTPFHPPRASAAATIHTHLVARLTETLDQLTAAACAKDPARFSTLLDGRRGVGGVYQWWQRLRAVRDGERFNPAHGSLRPPQH